MGVLRVAEYEREELLNEILPNVASQLRGPLGNMHVAILRMKNSCEENEAAERNMAILSQSYYRAMRLVNNLSAAPMLTETAPFLTANVDLVAWADELVRQTQPLAEEAGVEVRFETELRHHSVAIHKNHMERLFWNLMSNALKFTPRGGSVTVTVRLSGKQVLLEVADTGCGISEDLLETVFDRYLHPERMDPQPHGLGLGLPLCRRIAEGHGGRLLLSSRVGEGTTVTVALPDKKHMVAVVRDPGFHYAGGFQPVLMELSDALPYGAFRERHID
jgi:signal transduction histidine kinase